ncbi:MAG: carbamoyl transferase [Candidatus Omnitrophica bacterium]|nr:carbamoyl transferase [Candidatus Omnitrophota bacterium]
MKILSLYWGLCSSASLLVDGVVAKAVHEERFTRKKNEDAFPEKAIQYCLKDLKNGAQDLDGVALASYVSPLDDILVKRSTWSTEDYLHEQRFRWKPYLIQGEKKLKSLIETFPEKIDFDQFPSEYFKANFEKPDRMEQFYRDRTKLVADYLAIPEEKVHLIEHHRCHAAYAYYSSPFRDKEVLAFTIDGMGDGLNATIGIFDNKATYRRVYETAECNIGRIYRYITLVLGMKPNEHEFKVMGLAPYGKEKYAKRALDCFRETLYVEGHEFKWKIKPTDSYFWFRDRLEGVRFDNIAWALQIWVEELLTAWVQNAVKDFGISTVVLSGGVAMNIKAMGKIAELPEVKKMFIGGSGSDESMAISSGICLAEDLAQEKGQKWDAKQVADLPHLYLGPDADFASEEQAVKKLDQRHFEVRKGVDVESIAQLLADGKIIARSAGRMEFGQRALGNRSIFADPSRLEAKEKINAAIKSRDFWMPFAPVVMDKCADRYLLNPKKLKCPHMTIGFATTDEGHAAMPAACHPADRSARPQILNREVNPDVYALLEAFEKITGRGALLNTSFNLHGFPIVNTPEDAIYVLENSGLEGLWLNHFLILKKV